jgi:PilZ domain
MVETRIAPRYRVMKAGTIEFRGQTIDCMIRDLSITGAALEVPHQRAAPDKFVLVMPDDGLRLPCHVVWRKDYRIGVTFD